MFGYCSTRSDDEDEKETHADAQADGGVLSSAFAESLLVDGCEASVISDGDLIVDPKHVVAVHENRKISLPPLWMTKPVDSSRRLANESKKFNRGTETNICRKRPERAEVIVHHVEDKADFKSGNKSNVASNHDKKSPSEWFNTSGFSTDLRFGSSDFYDEEIQSFTPDESWSDSWQEADSCPLLKIDSSLISGSRSGSYSLRKEYAKSLPVIFQKDICALKRSSVFDSSDEDSEHNDKRKFFKDESSDVVPDLLYNEKCEKLLNESVGSTERLSDPDDWAERTKSLRHEFSINEVKRLYKVSLSRSQRPDFSPGRTHLKSGNDNEQNSGCENQKVARDANKQTKANYYGKDLGEPSIKNAVSDHCVKGELNHTESLDKNVDSVNMRGRTLSTPPANLDDRPVAAALNNPSNFSVLLKRELRKDGKPQSLSSCSVRPKGTFLRKRSRTFLCCSGKKVPGIISDRTKENGHVSSNSDGKITENTDVRVVDKEGIVADATTALSNEPAKKQGCSDLFEKYHSTVVNGNAGTTFTNAERVSEESPSDECYSNDFASGTCSSDQEELKTFVRPPIEFRAARKRSVASKTSKTSFNDFWSKDPLNGHEKPRHSFGINEKFYVSKKNSCWADYSFGAKGSPSVSCASYEISNSMLTADSNNESKDFPTELTGAGTKTKDNSTCSVVSAENDSSRTSSNIICDVLQSSIDSKPNNNVFAICDNLGGSSENLNETAVNGVPKHLPKKTGSNVRSANEEDCIEGGQYDFLNGSSFDVNSEFCGSSFSHNDWDMNCEPTTKDSSSVFEKPQQRDLHGDFRPSTKIEILPMEEIGKLQGYFREQIISYESAKKSFDSEVEKLKQQQTDFLKDKEAFMTQMEKDKETFSHETKLVHDKLKDAKRRLQIESSNNQKLVNQLDEKNEEIDALREKISHLESELKYKDTKHSSAISRLRQQIEMMANSKNELAEELNCALQHNKVLMTQIERMKQIRKNSQTDNSYASTKLCGSQKAFTVGVVQDYIGRSDSLGASKYSGDTSNNCNVSKASSKVHATVRRAASVGASSRNASPGDLPRRVGLSCSSNGHSTLIRSSSNGDLDGSTKNTCTKKNSIGNGFLSSVGSNMIQKISQIKISSDIVAPSKNGLPENSSHEDIKSTSAVTRNVRSCSIVSAKTSPFKLSPRKETEESRSPSLKCKSGKITMKPNLSAKTNETIVIKSMDKSKFSAQCSNSKSSDTLKNESVDTESSVDFDGSISSCNDSTCNEISSDSLPIPIEEPTSKGLDSSYVNASNKQMLISNINTSKNEGSVRPVFLSDPGPPVLPEVLAGVFGNPTYPNVSCSPVVFDRFNNMVNLTPSDQYTYSSSQRFIGSSGTNYPSTTFSTHGGSPHALNIVNSNNVQSCSQYRNLVMPVTNTVKEPAQSGRTAPCSSRRPDATTFSHILNSGFGTCMEDAYSEFNSNGTTSQLAAERSASNQAERSSIQSTQDQLKNVGIPFERLQQCNFEGAWHEAEEVLHSVVYKSDSKYVSRTPMVSQADHEGKNTFYFLDGHKEILFAHGLRKIILTNGWHFVLFVNGDVKAQSPEGIQLYRFAIGIIQVTTKDGMQFNRFSNGQRECTSSCGRYTQIIFANGMTKTVINDTK